MMESNQNTYIETNRGYNFVFMTADRVENLIIRFLIQMFALFVKYETWCGSVLVRPQDTEEPAAYPAITVYVGGDTRAMDVGFGRFGEGSKQIQTHPDDANSVKEFQELTGEWIFPLMFKVQATNKSACVKIADFVMISLMGPFFKKLMGAGFKIPFNSTAFSMPTVEKRQGTHGIWSCTITLSNVALAWKQLYLMEGDVAEQVEFILQRIPLEGDSSH